MPTSARRSRPRARWLVLGALAVAAALFWLWRTATDDQPPAVPDEPAAGRRVGAMRVPAPPTLDDGRPAPAATADDEPGLPPPADAAPAAGRPPLYDRSTRSFDPATDHVADPCTAPHPVTLPAEYAVYADHGVTVAWARATPGSFQQPVRARELVGIVRGIVDDAAALTGTVARPDLVVIIDASRDDYIASTGAPSWSGGFWDGGAIRTYNDGFDAFQPELRTLRHEIMHAQLHATVGCMPIWMHEGLAQYFDGTAPVATWLAMLRDGRAPAPGDLADRAMTRAESVDRAYAMSLAMVLYLAPRGRAGAIPAAIAAVGATTSRDAAMSIWDVLAPGVGVGPVLDTLAARILDGDRAEVLTGPVCCRGMHVVTDLRCRRAASTPPASDPRRRSWTERTPPPEMTCNASW